MVSVIGFRNSELQRYCTKLNYNIIDGISKLIEASKQTNFISYVDLSHCNIKEYKDFEFLSLTEPSYFWIKHEEILTSQQTQKNKLKSLLKENYISELSEEENLVLNDYNQIFNSGYLKIQYNQ